MVDQMHRPHTRLVLTVEALCCPACASTDLRTLGRESRQAVRGQWRCRGCGIRFPEVPSPDLTVLHVVR